MTHGSYGDGQVAPVIAVLKQAPGITDIALNYIDLSDEGCCELLSFLAKHNVVTSLELFGNRIGLAIDAPMLSSLLADLRQLQLRIDPAFAEFADADTSEIGRQHHICFWSVT